MSCLTCNYISGHAQTCPQYAESVAEDVEARLLARIETLEERVRQLEERNETRDLAARQLGRVQ